MTINEKVLEVLDEFKIPRDDALCYLVSLFYGYSPSYVPDSLKQKLNTTKIYVVDNMAKNSYKWNVPLFDNQITAFDWVKTEYNVLFKEVNQERSGFIKESVLRLKKLFAKNPEIRKDDVLNATKFYLANTDSKYIMSCHYFIEKGTGLDKTETLLTWIDRYKERELLEINKSQITNTLQ